MIHVIGMSHAINVLKALLGDELSVTHENWVSNDSNFMQFTEISATVISEKLGWGEVAVIDGDQINMSDGFHDLVCKLRADKSRFRAIVTLINGGELFLETLAQREPMIDFFVKGIEWSANPKARPIVSRNILTRILSISKNTIQINQALSLLLPDLPIYIIMPPPPVADAAHISKFLPEICAGIDKFSVSDFNLRRKFYTLYCAAIKTAVSNKNVFYVEPPPLALGSGGDLLTDFAMDAFHGNTRYGALVASQLKNLGLV